MNLLDLRLGNILDLSPLGQILGFLVLAFAAVRFTQRVTHSPQPDLFALSLCGLPLAVQPFFLQNLSYKFDALPMLMSQALAVFACVLPIQWSSKQKFAVCFALLMGVMSFYQTGVNTFLALSLLIFLCDYQHEHNATAWGDLGVKIVAFIASALVYKDFIIPATIHGTFEHHLAVTLDLRTLPFHAFAENMTNILALVSVLLTQGARPLLLGLYGVAALGAFVTGFHYFRKKNLSDFCAGVLFLLAPFTLLLLLSGMLLILKNVEFVPRILTSFSACIIFTNLFFLKPGLQKIRWIALTPLFYFYVIAYSYGNLLAENARFELFHIQRIASALDDAGFHSGDTLFLYGDEPLSPIVANAVKAMPLLALLKPDKAIHGESYFGYAILKSRGIESIEHTAQTQSEAQGCMTQNNQIHAATDFTIFRINRVFCVKEQ
ncbi:hypothetical protein AA0473_1627 [Acetobacter orleanensis NRIC 0473]|nr:hypothetical protein AD949_04840 [Acetobacter orleanensis]GBR28064.1 hypothetical protein AA0473_1627 [Acetobacter orleanensis NRIC 0473]